MKNLIEISKIVTKRKVSKIEIFDDNQIKNKTSKFNEFYEALATQKFKNDRDAAQSLYDSTPTDPKYRQLKSRFKRRLLNTLYFLDINKPSNPNYDKAFYNCNREWALVQILLANGAEHTAASMAKHILTVSLKYRFTDMIINCSRVLRAHFSKAGDEKSYELYDGYIKEYSNILEAELRSEELYHRVNIEYSKPTIRFNALEERINNYCEALVGLSEVYDSPVIYYNMCLVWILRYEMSKEYEAMLEVCSQLEDYMENSSDYYQEEKSILLHTKKMIACLHLKNYKLGKKNAEKCLNAFSEGSYNWFTFMEYYLLLALHTEQYIQATAIFNQSISHSKFKKLDLHTKEKWHIYEAYINYIRESQGQKNPVLKMQTLRPFRLNRFLNSHPDYPKEQRILTILILILQILFLLEKRNYTAISDLIDKLRNYANQQLKKDIHYRPIQFIRLLQQLKKSGYSIDDITNVEKYYGNLSQFPFSYRNSVSELEIIPYEKLWQMVTSYFD